MTMMKDDGDALNRLRNSLSKMEGRLHVLEQQVAVETQIAYFKHSDMMRRSPDRATFPTTDDECEQTFLKLCQDESLTLDDKRRLLTMLAISKNVKAYRMLEAYSEAPYVDMKDWAYMALMECRISLESELSDEKQIYISTGLGGKGEKLRFFLLLFARNKVPFQDYQLQTLERELVYTLSKNDCEIERLTMEDLYVEMLFLVPVRIDLKGVINQIINECNQYGNFLSNVFTVTNVRELRREEIEDILSKADENS